MNIKRYLGAALALAIFIFLFGGFVHGFLLAGTYRETASVWRDYAEMTKNMPLEVIFKILFAGWITFIFTQFYKNGGWKTGLRFGLFIGVLIGIQAASSYLWLPIPASLAASWFFSNVVEGVIGGLIIGSIYRK